MNIVDAIPTWLGVPQFASKPISDKDLHNVLAVHDLGIGSVWLGTWPQEEKIAAQRKLFDLPESAVPHSIIAFGYPDESQKDLPARGGYEDDRVHLEKW